MELFLNVPYAEKNEAKTLGAKWNAKIKKWYIDTPLRRLYKIFEMDFKGNR